MKTDAVRAWQSPAQLVALDERDAYPNEALRHLHHSGMAPQYVPADLGGRLRSFDALWRAWRAVARQDFTAATAHGATFAGVAPVWIGGNRALQERTAAIVLGGDAVALGFTERDHGADLLATETVAAPAASGFRLRGEKWLISNAVRATAMTVFARTSAAGGPRGFTFFLVEKGRIDHRSWTALPPVKTHGIRGAEIGGVTFRDCLVPADALIGAPGSGLEIALKSLQMTRTLATAGALGSAETALRIAVESGATDDDAGDEAIADAYVDLLIGECVAITSARALHVVPEQASVLSAVAKYFVPLTVTAVVEQLADAIGWRACVRDGPTAMFQKLRRDLPIVSLFDGSAPVNLNAIALQLGQLSTAPPPGSLPAGALSRFENVCRLDAALPAFNASGLDLTNRGRNLILDVLPTVIDGEPRRDAIGICQRALIAAVDEWRALARGVLSRRVADKAPELFELARAYATLHAAACGLAVWQVNRDRFGDFFARGDWLVRGVSRLVRACDPSFGVAEASAATIADEVRQRVRESQSLSIT